MLYVSDVGLINILNGHTALHTATGLKYTKWPEKCILNGLLRTIHRHITTKCVSFLENGK